MKRLFRRITRFRDKYPLLFDFVLRITRRCKRIKYPFARILPDKFEAKDRIQTPHGACGVCGFLFATFCLERLARHLTRQSLAIFLVLCDIYATYYTTFFLRYITCYNSPIGIESTLKPNK